MEIAKEILRQLGGNKFAVMTGSKNFGFSGKNGETLSMHLTKNNLKAKYLQITLTPEDTYTMKFSTMKKFEFLEIKTIEGVYCDMLRDIFETETGLRTSL